MPSFIRKLKFKRGFLIAILALFVAGISYESHAGGGRRLLSKLNNIRKQIHSNSLKVLTNPAALLNPREMGILDVYVSTSPVRVNKSTSVAEIIRLSDTAGGDTAGKNITIGR